MFSFFLNLNRNAIGNAYRTRVLVQYSVSTTSQNRPTGINVDFRLVLVDCEHPRLVVRRLWHYSRVSRLFDARTI